MDIVQLTTRTFVLRNLRQRIALSPEENPAAPAWDRINPMPRTKEKSGEHYEIAYECGAINELSACETVSKMKAESALGKRNGANACPEMYPLLQQTINDQAPVAIDLYELRDPYELYTRFIDTVCTLLR